IEHGGGHLGVAEDLGPIGEGEVGGDQQRGVLVELADQMEQQLPTGLAEREIPSSSMTMRSWRSRFSANLPLLPAAFSCSSWLTRSTRLKNRPLARLRITAEAMAIHRWVFPVPVPPMKIPLRLASRKAPVASSRTCPSSTGVSAKTKVSRSLRTGNLA